MERTLEGIEAQLRSEEVGMGMDCLRNAKRFHTTIGFIAGTGLKDATGNGTLRPSSPILLRLFDAEWIVCSAQVQPTNEGLPPQRTPLRNRRRQNPRILLLIFGHINHKLKLSPCPIYGALPLVEAISRDFNDQLLRVLTSHQFPYTPYETFDRLLT